MDKYRVTVEAPGFQEVHEFEADSPEEAEELGKEIFYDICNYGVSPVVDEPE